MKVYITGASGFIGNRIGLLFAEKGHDVVGCDKESSNDSFPIKQIDLNNEENIIAELSFYTPDIIIHCAGSADVGKSVKDPIGDYEGNVTITHNLLFAMHKLNMNNTRLVFLSSAGVYGNPEILPINEEIQLNPLSPYAVHKVMCEVLCKYFVSNYDMDIKIARIFSAYGVGLKKQIFWDMYNKLKSTGELNMFGTGDESRDYINIEDLVKVLYLISVTDSKEVVFNVANGEEITIREAAELFADCAGIDRKVIHFNGVVREGDPLNWKADVSRLKALGYKKTINIKQGLQEYYVWAEKQKWE